MLSALNRVLPRSRWGYLLAFVFMAACMGYAFYLQYHESQEPGPMCYFQRAVLVAMGLVFLVAAVHNPQRRGQWIYAVGETLLGALGVFLSLRHLWIQSLPLDQIPDCGFGITYMMDNMPLLEVIKKTLQGSPSCHDSSFRILGLTLPGWTLIIYLSLTAWSYLMVGRRKP